MKKGRILVVFYSRTGHTRKLGERIAKILKADKEEIIDSDNREGLFGWLRGGKDAYKRKLAKISYKKDCSNYDLVIIGTPVWAGTMTPAVRTYIQENKEKFRKIAFFCTFGGSEAKTFGEMQDLGSKPIAVLGLKSRDSENKEKIEEFCRKLK